MARLNSRQTSVVLGVPAVILVVGLALQRTMEGVAIPVLLALSCAFLAYLVMESRAFALSLFERQLLETRAGYAQTEALQNILWTLKPGMPLPSTRFWAASPDLLREITTHVLAERPQLVVEASSGTSTVVIALCLQRLGSGRVIALEHDPVYAAKTRTALQMHGLADHATVLHAPLVEHRVNGAVHNWYDLSQVTLPTTVDLLVVDGPPDTTQPLARYPAVPLLKEHFSEGARVLLDDGSRSDERTTAQRWAAEIPGSTLEFLHMEAGAWSLRLP